MDNIRRIVNFPTYLMIIATLYALALIWWRTRHC